MPSKNLHVLISADAKDAEAKVSAFEAKLSRLTSATSGLRAGMAAVVGGADPFDMLKGGAMNLLGEVPKVGPALQAGAALAESFYSKIRETQKGIAEQGKAAIAAGADIETYSGLLYAAGGNNELLNKALAKTSLAVGRAAMEGGEAADAFARLGLDVGALSRDDSGQQMMRLAGALEKVRNQTERQTLAHKVLGRSSEESMGLLMKGEKGLQDLIDRGRAKGRIVTGNDVGAALQVSAAMKQAEMAADSVWKLIATAAATPMTKFAEQVAGADAGIDKDTAAVDRLAVALQIMYDVGTKPPWEWLDVAPKAVEYHLDLKAKRQEMIENFKRDQSDLAFQEAAKRERAWMDQLGRAASPIDEADTAYKRLMDDVQRGALYIDDAYSAWERFVATWSRTKLPGTVGPFDRIMEQADELQKALDDKRGLLTQKQYLMAMGQLGQQLEHNANAANRMNAEFKAPEIYERGSTGAYSAETKFQHDDQAATEARANQKDLKEILRDMKAGQDKLIEYGKVVAESVKGIKTEKGR